MLHNYKTHRTNGICILDQFFDRLDGENLLVSFMQEPGSAWVAHNAVCNQHQKPELFIIEYNEA